MCCIHVYILGQAIVWLIHLLNVHGTTLYNYWTSLVFFTIFIFFIPPWTGTQIKIILKRKPAAVLKYMNYLPQQLISRTEDISVTVHMMEQFKKIYILEKDMIYSRKSVYCTFLISSVYLILYIAIQPFCSKLLEYKIANAKFLSEFHLVNICPKNKSEVLNSTRCASCGH